MIRTVLSLIVLIFVSISCSHDFYTNDEEIEVSIPDDAHVFLIGFDGWSSSSFEEATIPTLRQHMIKGCYTLRKKSVLPSSSAPNWASMFMGVGPDIHGYTEWDSKVPLKPYIINRETKQFPTIFNLLRTQKPESEIGLFYEWSGIKYVVDTLAFSTIYHFDYANFRTQAVINDTLKRYIINKKPKLLSVIYAEPDVIGHSVGFNSLEYLDTLKTCDECVLNVIDSVREAGIYEKSIFIVTSDHGGKGYDHGGGSSEEIYTPFIIWGYHVKEKGLFSAPMNQYDVAPTIASILSLQVPDEWIGKPLLHLFE